MHVGRLKLPVSQHFNARHYALQ